jgi:hypothetical protein
MQEATKRSKWFKFASVNFGNGTAKYPSDNVGVSTAWTPPNAFEMLTLEEQSAIIDAVRDGKGELRLDGRAGDWVGKTVAEALEWDPRDDDAKREIKAIVHAVIDKGYLAVDKRKDAHRKIRDFVVATDKELEV